MHRWTGLDSLHRQPPASVGKNDSFEAESNTLPLSSVPVPGQASGGGSTKLIVFCKSSLTVEDHFASTPLEDKYHSSQVPTECSSSYSSH